MVLMGNLTVRYPNHRFLMRKREDKSRPTTKSQQPVTRTCREDWMLRAPCLSLGEDSRDDDLKELL